MLQVCLSQPVLLIHNHQPQVFELHLLALLREHVQHLALVHLVKGDSGQAVKQARLEVGHHAGGVAAQGQDLQQRRV